MAGLSIWSRYPRSSCARAVRALSVLVHPLTPRRRCPPTWPASAFRFSGLRPKLFFFFTTTEEEGTQVTSSTSHSQKLARVFFLTSLIRQTATPCHSLNLSGSQFPHL